YERMARGYEMRREVMERYPGTREVFLAGGAPPRVGDLFRQPDLARTLELLAQHGHDGFYRGEVARKLVEGVNAEGGQWTLEELASYTVKEREPVRFRYRGWEIITAPPPSSGGIALAQMLQILQGWELDRLDEVQRTHLVVESMRRAYRDRTFHLGDPDFVKVPQRLLTSPDYAAGLRATIHPARATPSELLSGEATPLEDEDTTHFSIIDAQGNRAAVTQTVNLLYGSGLVAPGTGVLLNNEMDDFALRPGIPNAFGVMGYDANAPAPGKRMLSSMTPTFMVSPERVAVLGTPGGSRIITMVLLGILGYDAGLDAQAVAALPRYHHQWMPDRIQAEAGAFDPDVAQGLRDLGHTLQLPGDEAEGGRGSSHVWGNLQTVEWRLSDNSLGAGFDPRNPVPSGATRPAGAAAGGPDERGTRPGSCGRSRVTRRSSTAARCSATRRARCGRAGPRPTTPTASSWPRGACWPHRSTARWCCSRPGSARSSTRACASATALPSRTTCCSIPCARPGSSTATSTWWCSATCISTMPAACWRRGRPAVRPNCCSRTPPSSSVGATGSAPATRIRATAPASSRNCRRCSRPAAGSSSSTATMRRRWAGRCGSTGATATRRA